MPPPRKPKIGIRDWIRWHLTLTPRTLRDLAIFLCAVVLIVALFLRELRDPGALAGYHLARVTNISASLAGGKDGVDYLVSATLRSGKEVRFRYKRAILPFDEGEEICLARYRYTRAESNRYALAALAACSDLQGTSSGT